MKKLLLLISRAQTEKKELRKIIELNNAILGELGMGGLVGEECPIDNERDFYLHEKMVREKAVVAEENIRKAEETFLQKKLRFY